jgi:hypothetical protein
MGLAYGLSTRTSWGRLEKRIQPLLTTQVRQGISRFRRGAIPERAWDVKGFLVCFFAYSGRRSLGRLLCVGWLRVFEPSRLQALGCHGLVFEVVEPFFSLRLHPNTSLRECVCPCGQPSRSAGDLTPSILLRPSRTAWPSQSGVRPACAAETKWHLRLALPARASSTREGPMQPSFLRMRCLFCLGVLSELWRPVGCVLFRITERPSHGTEKRVGGAGGGASSPCSTARCRRNFRMDALGRTLHLRSPRATAPLLRLTRSSCGASAAADRPPCTARCA